LRAAVAQTLLVEIGLLPLLAPALPAPMPQFRYVAPHGAPTDPAFPFVGYPLLPGVPLTTLRPNTPLLAELAAFLHALHTFPSATAVAAGVPARDWSGWVAQWAQFRQTVLAGLAGRATPPVLAWVADHLAAFLAELQRTPLPLTLIHHDLAPEHLLVTPDGTHLAAVIDWGDVALGDPALDFVGLAAVADPATLATLLAAYGPVDTRLLVRVAWYGTLGPCHLLHYGLAINDPAVIAAAVGQLTAQAAQAAGTAPSLP
jgi:aminoglycoside phosphotransferase (APT) family kinase protein